MIFSGEAFVSISSDKDITLLGTPPQKKRMFSLAFGELLYHKAKADWPSTEFITVFKDNLTTPIGQIHPLYFTWFSFEFFSLKTLCSHIFPFSLTAFFTQLPDFSKNSFIGPWMTRRKESISNSFLFSSKNCVRDKPDDASSCTWQSSCSHTRSFYRKHSSLKENINQHGISTISKKKLI